MTATRRCDACGGPSPRPACTTCATDGDHVLVRPYVERPAAPPAATTPDDSMTMTWEFPAAAVPATGDASDGRTGQGAARPGTATTGEPAPPAGTGPDHAGSGDALPDRPGGRRRPRRRNRLILIGAAIVLVVAAPLALARIGAQDVPYDAPAAAPPGLFTPAPARSAGDPSKAGLTPSASPRASSAAPASRGERSVLPSPSAPADSADPTPSTPTPSVLTDGVPTTGQIVGASGMCVDNMNNRTSHGNPITMAPCNDTGAQRWSFHQDGTLQVHRMCMGPAGNGTSSPVQLRRCGRGPGPAWQYRSNGAVVHVRSGLCLHDRSGSGGPVAPNGAPQLTITACTGTAGQRWTYR